MIRSPIASTRGQTGAAVITAMLVVALAASIVSALYARQNVTIRSIENRLNLSQSRWIERAATDWAKVILRNDFAANRNVDHKGEFWAIKVDQTALDETVTAGGKIDSVAARAQLQGSMDDAQAYFNITNLVKDGVVEKVELNTLERLLQLLSLPTELASAITNSMTQRWPKDKEGNPQKGYLVLFKRPADFIQIPGFDQRIIGILSDHVMILPQRTAINVNTATPEVLAASLGATIGAFDLTQARGFSEQAATRFAKDLNEFRTMNRIQDPLSDGRFDVKTSFFLLRGQVRFDRIVSRTVTLLDRGKTPIEVVWQDRY